MPILTCLGIDSRHSVSYEFICSLKKILTLHFCYFCPSSRHAPYLRLMATLCAFYFTSLLSLYLCLLIFSSAFSAAFWYYFALFSFGFRLGISDIGLIRLLARTAIRFPSPSPAPPPSPVSYSLRCYRLKLVFGAYQTLHNDLPLTR
jgi:hypothetical protein